MATWLKRGVHLNLIPEAAAGLRRVEWLFGNEGCNLFITSGNDSTHGNGSYHYIDRAWDQRPNPKIPRDEIWEHLNPYHGGPQARKILFDVVDEGNHVHVEFDPK